MPDISTWFATYGVLAVFLGVFVKQLGAPLPALPLLVLAGAQGAHDAVYLLTALLAGALAALLADALWFLAGRRYGRSALGLVCRVTLSPDTCIRKSEISFERAGALAVLFAKFLPGVSMVIRPLAGALGMRAAPFLVLDLVGSILWAGSGLAAGVLLQRQLAGILRWLGEMGSTAAVVLLLALALYVVARIAARLSVHAQLRRMERVPADQLARMLQRGDKVVVLDVRGPGSAPAARIPGAVPVKVGSDGFDCVPGPQPGTQIVTYCDCPHDATAARAAMQIARRGCPVRVLEGGFDAWVAAGFPVEACAAAGGKGERAP